MQHSPGGPELERMDYRHALGLGLLKTHIASKKLCIILQHLLLIQYNLVKWVYKE